MSQHDFNIANQTFPSFRSDLNDALQASATMSAGSSAPTTPYAYQLWFDTTTDTWKVRNSGNTAWISTITTDLATGNVGIGTSSPARNLEISDSGTPTIRLQDTGGTNQYAELLVSGSSTILQARNDTADGNIIFRGLGGGSTTERMRINSSGNVGIGTTSPAEELEISADAPSMQLSSTNASGRDYGLQSTNNGNFAFYDGTAGVNRIVINSSGSVGIGTSSPTHILHTSGTGQTAKFESSNNSYQIELNYNNNTSRAFVGSFSNGLVFAPSSASEAMRIDSSGNLLVGSTYAAFNARQMTRFEATGTSTVGHVVWGGGSSGQKFVQFINSGGGEVGSITQSGGAAAAYNTSSDYRLKTAVTYDWDATSRLKQLKPARFKWIVDGDDAVPVDGFLAHEVQDVVPESITGTKDAMRDEEYQVSAATGDIYTPAIDAVIDEDGNEVTPAVAEVIHSTDVERPEELAEGQQWRETTAAVMGTRSVPDYQGIDQSKLTPLLTKALIEAVEKIEQLETRIAALEAN